MMFELKKELLKKADEKAGFSGEIYILALPSGAIKVNINDFTLIKSGFTSQCHIFKKRKIPTMQFMGGGFGGTQLCGDAIITMNEMGYDLTNKDDINKAKKQDREKIVAEYEKLISEKPELFDASKVAQDNFEAEVNKQKDKFEIKSEYIRKGDSGQLSMIIIPSGICAVLINTFGKPVSNDFCEFTKKKTNCILIDVGIGIYVCGDILITMKEMGYDLANKDDWKRAKKEEREKILAECNRLVSNNIELFDDSKVDSNKLEDEINRLKTKYIEESIKQATELYQQNVNYRIDSLSDYIGDGEEVISVIFGNEVKKEDGEKTGFWDSVFNEGTLLATNIKVIYATKHRSSGRINVDEFIYASIKGVQKRQSSGGFVTVQIISVDDQAYGLRFSGNGKEMLKAANKFVTYVNQMISGGGVHQATPTADDIPSQLKKLAELKDAGILTNEEFEDKKKELLARM